MTRDELRARLIDGIDRLSRRWILTDDDRRLLRAQRRLLDTDLGSTVLDRLLTLYEEEGQSER